MIEQLPTTQFPYHEVAFKVALSAGIGLLVGLEREWSHKEIGVRTFAIGGLLGLLTSLLGPPLVVSALIAVVVLVAFLDSRSWEDSPRVRFAKFLTSSYDDRI